MRKPFKIALLAIVLPILLLDVVYVTYHVATDAIHYFFPMPYGIVVNGTPTKDIAEAQKEAKKVEDALNHKAPALASKPPRCVMVGDPNLDAICQRILDIGKKIDELQGDTPPTPAPIRQSKANICSTMIADGYVTDCFKI